ncbi:hypothetical protein Pst134EB_023316 [Puccinia striiformis f. sp. tritici]|nr:hypothetical protein Pst134EB_023316 [Puccinia striiformis f. sp. tritici]
MPSLIRLPPHHPQLGPGAGNTGPSKQPTHILATVTRLSNRCNFSGAISLFHSDSQIHSPITTRSNIPISIPTMNYNNYVDFNAGEAEESQLQPSQRQGKPYQGIFFEETPVGGTPGNQAHPSDGAATSIPVPRLSP